MKKNKIKAIINVRKKNEYATPFRHLEDYYVAIKPDGTIVRCYDNNVPETFAFIGHDHPHRNNYYDVFNKLKPEFWACERFYNDKDGANF